MFVNATGYYIPEQRIPNEYFLDINGLTDDWIFQRTGIRTRSKAAAKETIEQMSIAAVKNACKHLPYSIQEVDLVIFASYTPSDTVGTVAHVVQRQFQIADAKAFALSSACSSAINAMEIIQSFFDTGRANKALLISADRNSTYVNESDSSNGHLWGDAAAVMFFSKEKISDHEPEIMDISSQGLGHIGKGPSGVYLNPKESIKMPHGKDVFVQACTYIAQNATDILYKNQYKLSDLSYFIGHQANMRIISNVAAKLNIPNEKVLCNIQELGNTGSVSSVLVFAQNYTKFRKGDLICLSVFGGGYSAGACLIRF